MIKRLVIYTISSIFFITGCSLVSFEPPCPADFVGVTDCFYKAGVASFEKKNYTAATVYFRKITPESPEYQNALKMIEKIPVARAKDAIKAGNYRQAIADLEGVADYFHNKKEADKLQLKIEYLRLQESLSQTALPQIKITIIDKMLKIFPHFQTAQDSIVIIGELKVLLERSHSAAEAQQVIRLLTQMVKIENSANILQIIQRIAFENIERLQNQRTTRNALLNLIALTKLKLQ